MKISVITPSFNQGCFIKDAIDSVINQGYDNFEHIVIDGGSSDETLDILKRYPHLRWVSEADEGQSDALNKGFKMATGDIICWLNADDFYLPGTFQKAIKQFSKFEIDGIYANVLFCDKDKKVVGRLKSHRPVRWLSLFHIFISSESFFFRRRIIDDGVFIDAKFHIAMDKEFMARILYQRYVVKYINDDFAVFRRHDANKSKNSRSVRQILRKEGLKIFVRYSRIRVPENELTLSLYRTTSLALLPFRKLLKQL